MSIRNKFESGERAASGRTTELERAAERLTRFHRVSWKEALGKIASPAFRLHRYRTVHNRILQNAFCELDRSDARDCDG